MDLLADLDAQLAAHECADAKELRDVAFVRAFLRAHPSDAHLRAQAVGHLTGSGLRVASRYTPNSSRLP